MIEYIVGIDEAGRGPLAGPLSVAAVCVPARGRVEDICPGVTDSKKLSATRRSELYTELTKYTAWAHVHIMPATLDRWGMTRALNVAVARVLAKLALEPSSTQVLLDGTLIAPTSYKNQETITKGDLTEPIIGAASIIAKVRRDRAMMRYAKRYPEYGFECHKGYGTAQHRQAIRTYGPCEIHRRRFLSHF